jgi:hypothetical protein
MWYKSFWLALGTCLVIGEALGDFQRINYPKKQETVFIDKIINYLKRMAFCAYPARKE